MVDLNLYPYLLNEYDISKNDIDPSEVKTMSKYWWLCSKSNHSYEATVGKRKNAGRGCPYCAGRYVIPGENDLTTLKPEIVHEFNIEKNGFLPSQITANSSSKKLWWKCKDGHEWEALPSHRRPKENTGNCPYCTDRFVVEGVNDVYTFAPELAEEIVNVNKIHTFTPDKIISLNCRFHNYQFRSTLRNRKAGKGCPYCTGRKRIAGVNDFPTLYPEVLKTWDFDKNTISPYGLSPENSNKFWWICELNHSFYSSIEGRTIGNKNCHYCDSAGGSKKLLSGFNDFASKFPDLIKEWNFEKNDLDPYRTFPSSQKEAHWICKHCSHEWTAAIASRAIGSRKCSLCFPKGRSQTEIEVFNFVENYLGYNIVSNDRNLIKPYEVDIYIPQLNKAIEFNGAYWHSDKFIRKSKGISAEQYHQNKSTKCIDKYVDLLHISEKDWTDSRTNVENQIQTFLKTPIGWSIVYSDCM